VRAGIELLKNDLRAQLFGEMQLQLEQLRSSVFRELIANAVKMEVAKAREEMEKLTEARLKELQAHYQGRGKSDRSVDSLTSTGDVRFPIAEELAVHERKWCAVLDAAQSERAAISAHAAGVGAIACQLVRQILRGATRFRSGRGSRHQGRCKRVGVVHVELAERSPESRPIHSPLPSLPFQPWLGRRPLVR